METLYIGYFKYGYVIMKHWVTETQVDCRLKAFFKHLFIFFLIYFDVKFLLKM